MEELRKQWITSEKEYREGEVFVYRQKFTASQVKKAMFYGTALGVYEAELNGTKIGRQMFAPGFSYYPRRVLYQTHEVTKLLREGENTLTVYLGQGWYCGRFLCENQTQIYGEQPASHGFWNWRMRREAERLSPMRRWRNWNPRMNMQESTMVRFILQTEERT